MLFDWLFSGLYFDKETGGGSGTDDGAGDPADKKKDESAEDSEAGDDKDKAKARDEKKFTQAELDQIVKDRLERERKKSEAEAEKVRKKAEEEALSKNQEWQKLAEQRQARIDELEKQSAELEPYQAEAKKYRAALEDQLKKVKEKLPKHLLPLIEKLDPVEAMAYITEHAEELGAKPSTYSETPDGKEKKVTDDDKKEAQKASTSVITRSF